MRPREQMDCYTIHDWGHVQGPIEFIQVANLLLPNDLNIALSHVGEVYLQLMDRLPLYSQLYLTLSDIPRDGLLPHIGSRTLVTNWGSVQVIFRMEDYILTLHYEYKEYSSLWQCHTHTHMGKRLMVVRHIKGIGSLVSALQLVMDYARENSHRYEQCYTCRYCSTDREYCGRGLIMNTGSCLQHMGPALTN